MNLSPSSSHVPAAGTKLAVYADLGLGLLSAGAGCTDVLAFLKLGGLFTSAMTGNTALLAIALGSGHLLAATRSLSAFLAFSLGVMLATAIAALSRQGEENRRRVLRRLLSLEFVLLVCCAGLWSANSESVQGGLLYTIIALSALSMGVQAVAARTSNASGINTIVFTTNLVNILMSATHALARLPAAGKQPARAGSHLHAFVAYAGGAVLAAFLVLHWTEVAIWIPVAAVPLALGCFELAGRLAALKAGVSP